MPYLKWKMQRMQTTNKRNQATTTTSTPNADHITAQYKINHQIIVWSIAIGNSQSSSIKNYAHCSIINGWSVDLDG